MPYVRRRNTNTRRNKRRVTRRPIKRAIRREKNRLFRTRVKNIIQSTAETKTVSNFIQNANPLQLYWAVGAAVGTNLWCLTPCDDTSVPVRLTIAKGTADGQRVGNQIRIKQAYLIFTMNAAAYSAGSNPVPRPQLIRLFFFKRRVNSNTTPSKPELCGTDANGTGGNWFQNGTGQNGMVGTVRDMTQQLNTDMYQYIASRTYKLGNSEAFGDGAQISSQYFTNNDFKYNIIKRINVTKMLPKVFKWNDADNIVTPPVWCLVQTVNADGSVPSLVNTYPVTCSVTLQWKYTDL